MRIALYYPCIYLTSGAERTILELSGRSRHQWTLFTSHYDPTHTFPGFAERKVVNVGEVSVDRSISAVAKAGWKLMNLRLPIAQYDLFVVVCEGLGDLVVFRNSSRPILCICLTPLRLTFDPAYKERCLRGRSLFSKLLVLAGSTVFRYLDRRAWKHYARVFCITQKVQRRILRGKLATEQKLEVLRVGLGFEPKPPSYRSEPFFLLPGRIMWTKNVELGIEAFRYFRTSRPEFGEFRLVIAGIVDKKSEVYLARLRELAASEPKIEFRIFPSDAELGELYHNCYTVLFTSFNEDWGIVPLEGMAFGKPVIAVNRGGPRESVVHGVQGFLERPDSEAFANRMGELAANPALALSMGKAGYEQSRQFSWRSFTDRIDEEIDHLGSSLEVFEPGANPLGWNTYAEIGA